MTASQDEISLRILLVLIKVVLINTVDDLVIVDHRRRWARVDIGKLEAIFDLLVVLRAQSPGIIELLWNIFRFFLGADDIAGLDSNEA